LALCHMKKNTNIAFALLALFLSGPIAYAQEFFTPPAEVTNVSVMASSGQIELTWDEGVDEDGLITGYKLYYGTSSVQTPEDMYESELAVSENSATLTDLTNNTRYYIAITAVDDEENESLTYSQEVSATPMAPSPPTIEDIEHLSNTEIIVNMSEPTTAENPKQAFQVQAAGATESVPISQAEFIGTSVILNFEEGVLLDGTTYTVTATESVEDSNGETVIRGSGDTGTFITPDALEEEDDPLDDFEEEEEEEEEEEFFPEDETDDPTEEATEEEDPFENITTSSQPPLEVRSLSFNDARLDSDNIVLLSWTESLDSDIADQVIYTRKEGLAWDSGYSIGADTYEIEIDVEPNENYEVKVITVNNAGLESDGASLEFSTHLTETGPAMMWGMVLMIILFGGIVSLSRRSTL